MAVESKYVDNILESTKKMLGIISYEYFDADLLNCINSVISSLIQMGIGPEEGFTVDENSEWSSFITDNLKLLQQVRPYVFIKVKLIFDPPTSKALLDSYEAQAKELEWRMYITKDNERINNEGGISQ